MDKEQRTSTPAPQLLIQIELGVHHGAFFSGISWLHVIQITLCSHVGQIPHNSEWATSLTRGLLTGIQGPR